MHDNRKSYIMKASVGPVFKRARELAFYSHTDPRVIRLDDMKILYFPIPKVACTTIKQLIAKSINIDIGSSVHRSSFPGVRTRLFGPSTAKLFPDYFKFAFVRDPWDRIVSFYKNKIEPNHKSDIRKYRHFPERCSFAEAIEIIKCIPDAKANSHFRSQSSFIFDSNERPLVDYIGRFENFNEDIQPILKRMNLSIDQVSKRNSTRATKQYDFFSEELYKEVFKRYSNDYRLLGYRHR